MRINEFITESSKICPQCGMRGCTCKPGKCNCKPKPGYPKQVDEAANPAQQAAIAIAMKKAGKKPKNMHEEDEGMFGRSKNDKRYLDKFDPTEVMNISDDPSKAHKTTGKGSLRTSKEDLEFAFGPPGEDDTWVLEFGNGLIATIYPQSNSGGMDWIIGGNHPDTEDFVHMAYSAALDDELEEEVDESALQAYLGDKKYGEDGMDALRDAGRKHVGKAKMQKIRAKFSNKEKAVSEEVDTGEYDARKSTHKGQPSKEQEKSFREKVEAYGKELEQRQKEKKVGENFINQVDQAVTSEGEHTQHAMRGRNPGANEFEHDFEPEDKIGNIHDKISKMLKRLEKPKHEPSMKDTDLGSTVIETTEPWETDEEAAEREKKEPKSKDTKGSDGSEHGGHSRAKHLAKQAIPKDEVKEGQEDFDAILRIIRK